ncbi:MAG: tetratricopeptide repeat protein [Pseudomonadota bacterium]
MYEASGVDIIHLSGHAGIDHELGPVFYMEDEIGNRVRASPDQLWEAIRDFPPRILFLSGCSTGKGDKLNGSEAFAHRMVDQGVPLVLGWGLPVSDEGATVFAAEVYELLAKGKGLDYAVRRARQSMQDRYHPWPLLRIFSDGSKLKPLIAAGQRLGPGTVRRITHKYLSDSQVRVLDSGFVGRRREIQKGLRVLKAMTDRYGLLIRGAAGVGKSCLAGRLIERLPGRELLVFHGVLKKADVLQKSLDLFDRIGLASGLDVLRSDREYGDKIKALFRGPFQKKFCLIYFDDFEQNLYRDGDRHYVNKEMIETIAPFLTALDWAQGNTQLMITSRYPFVLEIGGRNLPEQMLEDIPLMSFHGPDLEKKKNELPHTARSPHRALYLEFGRGNPRLMEWLEKIAENEHRYDLDALCAALQGRNEDFIRDYLAEVMARTEGEAFYRFLNRAAAYRIPVGQSAYAGFGLPGLLEKGVDLTLCEREDVPGRAPVYWVAPVIRESAWQKLDGEDRLLAHRQAYGWYDAVLTEDESEAANYAYREEAVHHALQCGNVRGACKHAIPLGKRLSELLLFRERLELQSRVAAGIDEKVVEEAKREKDGNVAVLFSDLGYVLQDLGASREAIDFYNKALAIDLEVFGDRHPSVARDYNNLGEGWGDLGEARKAIDFYTQALAIFTTVYGPDHPSTRTVEANINALKDEREKST